MSLGPGTCNAPPLPAVRLIKYWVVEVQRKELFDPEGKQGT